VGQHAHTLACIYARDRVLPRGPPPLNAQFRGHVVGGGVVPRTRWRPAESRCDADASRTESGGPDSGSGRNGGRHLRHPGGGPATGGRTLVPEASEFSGQPAPYQPRRRNG
jgi:hypothetical protein